MTFQSEDVVDKVCEIHFHEINNKMVSRAVQFCLLSLPHFKPVILRSLSDPDPGCFMGVRE